MTVDTSSVLTCNSNRCTFVHALDKAIDGVILKKFITQVITFNRLNELEQTDQDLSLHFSTQAHMLGLLVTQCPHATGLQAGMHAVGRLTFQ